MHQKLRDAVPTVVQIVSAAVQGCIGQSSASAVREFGAAMKCLESWLPILPSR
jgi:hypothetical protein